MLINIFLITIFGAVTCFCLTPLMIEVAKKYKLVDNPKLRPHPAHTHSGIIPRAGGVPIYLGIFIPLLLIIPLNQQLIGILIGATILIVIGLWDDRRDRSPYIRFITNCLVALIVIISGIGIPFITNPLGGILHLGYLSYVFAFIWIIWMTNIIGWSGGIDGQLPGFVSIASGVVGLLSLRFTNQDPELLRATYLSFLTAGSFLGFTPWNFYPQKIMPGYGGKTLAGFMLAVLSILSSSKLGTAILVLAVPMTDAAFMFIKRIISRKSPMKATSDHLHHHLLALGWGRRRIAVFYWIISAIFGIMALVLNSKQKVFAGILILVVIGGIIVLINSLRKFYHSTFSA